MVFEIVKIAFQGDPSENCVPGSGPCGHVPTDLPSPRATGWGSVYDVSNCISTHADTTHRQTPLWIVPATFRGREMPQRFRGKHGVAYGGRFTSGIHVPINSTNCDHVGEKEKRKKEETTSHPKTLGHLHKSRNEPISDFGRIVLPLFTKPIPHLFVLRHSPYVCSPHRVNPPGNPRALCNEHCASSVRPNRAFNDPASLRHSHERQPCRETERTDIRGMSDKAIRT